MQMMHDQPEFAKLPKTFQKQNGDFRAFGVPKCDGLALIDLDVDGQQTGGWVEGGIDASDFDDATFSGRHQDRFGFGQQSFRKSRVMGHSYHHRLATQLSQRDQNWCSCSECFPTAAEEIIDGVEPGYRFSNGLVFIHGPDSVE